MDRCSLQVQRGFSILELMIVVALLGVAAALAIPRLSATQDYELELAAAEFADAIRFARSEAMRTAIPRGFHIQESDRRIRVFRPDNLTPPWAAVYDVYHPVSKKLYDIDVDDHPLASVDNVTTNISHRGVCNFPKLVYFDRNGAPWCTDPATVLLSQVDITLSLGPLSRVVTLHGISGRVTVQ